MSHTKVRPENAEMKELAARICRDYLNGAWKKVTAQNIGFKHISGGLSNFLYYISLPETFASEKKNDNEPSQVLIRVYGQTHGERQLESIITESVIFTLLSERGLGPKLYGVFPGGRIEQYINARPLITRELSDDTLSMLIAQKMAAIHCMEVPLHKKPGWLWDTIERWLTSCSKLDRRVPEHVNLKDEAVWLKQRLEEEKCPVVFCHNDMQEGNILICQDENDNNETGPKLVLIDFEYCSYNYRSFDLANHFIEWTYDYTTPEYPYYTEDLEAYPSEAQRMRFIQAYLQETGFKENPRRILKEVQVFSLASHFFWTLWSFVNAETSKIPFGYWEYGISRLDSYFRVKKEISPLPPIKRKVSECD